MRDRVPRLPKGATAEERYWSKVQTSPGCHLWLGGTNGSGYGTFWDGTYTTKGNPRIVLAHRFGWELEHGPIPAGDQVLHKCPGGDNRLCQRHVYLGNNLQNVHDRLERGARAGCWGEDHHNAHLTQAQVNEIRSRITGVRGEQAALGREYGVSRHTVNDITHRRSWS